MDCTARPRVDHAHLAASSYRLLAEYASQYARRICYRCASV